ncbi:hypothetical protein UFOVP998_15 [uncultured Caudovirales phage]|uniref:Uncharacterized protein n=1 Tax=uncultured Caudovirales phage TaxID=2100421 RepID=A0A6J5PZB5_9CAUD|nr:hypothetical protein UFOVP998_15 [uncultured Caudovirales phage]CAB4199406.1 hypothetical protein UFOVP1331_44 [uncultured Caudovirales phage]CAB4212871.1 hypothetical protein UFOVP1442_31 [uncultured Caudovirales phage]CAB5228002.1 hypothetical protein UFOVP1535_20 [uncultured Caudovirales phage]
MGKPRGADRTTTTIPLSDGDHLVVINELLAGEESDAWQGAIARTRDESGVERVQLDNKSLEFTTAAHFIQSWSFIDQAGAPIVWPLSVADRVEILRTKLSGEDWAEVKKAITAHETVQAAKKKTTPTGKPEPTTT